MPNLPAIPEPRSDVGALYASVAALKEVVEILGDQRRDHASAAVTWRDMAQFNLGDGFPLPTVYSADGVTLALTLGVFSINPAYAGQASITTLGTIVTGVWHGSVIDVAHGGTGAAAAGGATLDNISGFGGTGLLARTGAGAYSFRTITGTAARIAVTNGGGVAAAPAIDIDATYAGQASITTLGTVTTGVWTATTIAVANGGTGGTTQATARTGLGLGTAAVENIGTSGANVPKLNAANTWSAQVTIAPGSNTTNFLSAGLTRGMRFAHDTTRSRIDGVDQTGVASYQPLGINGSQLDFFTSLTVRGTLTATLMDWLLPLRGVSLATAIVTVAANTALTDAHGTVLVNGNFTISLPTPAAGNTGRIIIIKAVSAAPTVTINVTGGANIDGAASTSITVQYNALRFQCNGTQWYTI